MVFFNDYDVMILKLKKNIILIEISSNKNIMHYIIKHIKVLFGYCHGTEEIEIMEIKTCLVEEIETWT